MTPPDTVGRVVQNANEGLSVTAAARYLGVSRGSIYNWIHQGALKVTKFGPTGAIVRIHQADLDDLRNPPPEG